MKTTPKNKAKELLDKFWNLGMMPDEAKKCVIILCDENIKMLLYKPCFWNQDLYNFWNDVKVEINS